MQRLPYYRPLVVRQPTSVLLEHLLEHLDARRRRLRQEAHDVVLVAQQTLAKSRRRDVRQRLAGGEHQLHVLVERRREPLERVRVVFVVRQAVDVDEHQNEVLVGREGRQQPHEVGPQVAPRDRDVGDVDAEHEVELLADAVDELLDVGAVACRPRVPHDGHQLAHDPVRHLATQRHRQTVMLLSNKAKQTNVCCDPINIISVLIDSTIT